MPNTEPQSNINTSIEMNPVALAFQLYLVELNEQYPGILEQFSQGITSAPYSIDGRMFFNNFRVNGKNFSFSQRSLLPEKIGDILIPLKTAVEQTEASIQNQEPAEDTLSQLDALKQTVLSSTRTYIDATKSQLPPPHEYIESALRNHSDIVKNIIQPLSKLKPDTSIETIQFLLDYREKACYEVLTRNGVNLLIGLLTIGYNNTTTPEETQAMGLAILFGTIFYKMVTDEAIIPKLTPEQNKEELKKGLPEYQPVSPQLKKFIITITNRGTNNAEDIAGENLETHRKNITTEFSPERLLELLNREPTKQTRSDIRGTVNYLPKRLNAAAVDRTFLAFQQDSFSILFEKLQEASTCLAAHEKTQFKYNAHILTFMADHFDAFKNYPEALKLATTLLRSMVFSKWGHRRTYEDHVKLLNTCENQLHTHEILARNKRFSQALHLAPIDESKDNQVEALVKKASTERYSKKIDPKTRTQSSLILHTGAISEQSNRRKIIRGVSGFFEGHHLTLHRDKSPRTSPDIVRKNNKSNRPESTSASPTPSPDAPRKREPKMRKTDIPETTLPNGLFSQPVNRPSRSNAITTPDQSKRLST